MKLGLIAGVAAIIVFIVGTTAAMIAYPDYRFFTQYFSELGINEEIVPNEEYVIPKISHSDIFNISLILTGILLIPFFPSAYLALQPEGKLPKTFLLFVIISGIMTSLFMFGIAVFDARNFLHKHIMAAVGLYYCLMATCFMWGMGILFLDGNSPYKQSKMWIIDPIACASGIAIGLINTRAIRLHRLFLDKFTYAFCQKILVYGFIFFLGYMGIRLMIVNHRGEMKARKQIQ